MVPKDYFTDAFILIEPRAPLDGSCETHLRVVALSCRTQVPCRVQHKAMGRSVLFQMEDEDGSNLNGRRSSSVVSLHSSQIHIGHQLATDSCVLVGAAAHTLPTEPAEVTVSNTTRQSAVNVCNRCDPSNRCSYCCTFDGFSNISGT